MAVRSSSRPHLAVLPGKHWAYRAISLLLAMVAVSLIGMSKSGNPNAERLRDSVLDVVSPALSVAARPLDAIHEASAWVSEMASLRDENIALKNENVQLLKWQSMAKSMEAENKSLRGMLNVVPPHGMTYIAARIIGDIGGPYANAALINGGSDNGIKKDEAAIVESGLVGRVVDVGATSARVLLLSDINSRIPVVVERTREKAILAGNHEGLPTLSYLAAGSNLTAGDRIVTSGDGGIFPADVPVGIVTGIEKGVVTVQPFADASRLEYVTLVDAAIKKP